mmetsp:Transcript_67302/g.146685  ORF Transcript_67302/g.146685 Transcript_67302/m.146685 type:complete len:84 (+) Transcript_67302:240-491(+)
MSASEAHVGQDMRTDILVGPDVARHPREAQHKASTTILLQDLGLKSGSLTLAPNQEVRDLPVADPVLGQGTEHLLDDLLWWST